MDSLPTPQANRHAVLKRALVLTGVIGASVGLAFVVGRQRISDESVAVNYLATRGPRPPGLKIFLRRGEEMDVLDPATELRHGDELHFMVRASAPRYLVLRARDGAGHDQLLFPTHSAATALLVQPDQRLELPLEIDGSPGKETITAIFGELPFSVDAPTQSNDVQVVTIALNKKP